LVILVAFSAGSGTSTLTCSPAPSEGSASMAPGRTVITGVSPLAWPSTVNAPPKMDQMALLSAFTSTTSTNRPDPIRAASRPAISLPSALAASKTAAGLADSASDASTSTEGVMR
jgi:hypothetical protein